MSAKHCKGKELYPHLFEPIRIGNIRLKNRIISAPTSPSMIDTEGHMTLEMTAYLEEKAKGGVAVVTYGEAIVHSATGKSHNKQLQLDSFGVKQGLAETSRAIHNAGAYANIQLSHGGKYGGLESVGGDQDRPEVAYGPSHEMTPEGEVFEMPREMIYEIIESYKTSAKLCKDCGFDMVQVHAAHGWLFSQFLSPVMNKRTDEFGGSLENRARFLLLALDAVREGVGPHFPIEIRIAGDDLTDVGLNMEDCIKVGLMVEDKVDLFNVSCGNHEDPEMFCRTHPSVFYPRGVNVYLAAEFKKYVKKPVACVGSLNDPAQMEEIIATGQADIVEIGRALLADPYLANKALEGRADDITPCLRCYECFGETMKSETVKCAVNPTMGQQLWEKNRKANNGPAKKVLVAGGGPAGMEAAITAARNGHDVTLVEKSGKLGGNLHPAGAAYFKNDIRLLEKVLEKRVNESGVKVILNTEVTPEYVKSFDPDALFVAIGSNELRPPIKGMDLSNVIMAIDAELNPEKLGKRVAVMGGGLVGAESAVSFYHEGREVSIIEMKGNVTLVTKDECVRPGTSMEILGKLRPAFIENGRVTAGTSSPMSDGSGAVVVMEKERALREGKKIWAKFIDWAVVGCDPSIMGIGPVGAIRKLLKQTGLTLDDVDLIELNEAFASQSIACIRELGLDMAKVNVNGGALALGHPLAGTGGILTTKLVYEMERRNSRYGIVAFCMAGGQGGAALFERI